MSVIRLRHDQVGGHVAVRVFVGPDVDHLANVGILTMLPTELEDLTAVLMAGASEADLGPNVSTFRQGEAFRSSTSCFAPTNPVTTRETPEDPDEDHEDLGFNDLDTCDDRTLGERKP